MGHSWDQNAEQKEPLSFIMEQTWPCVISNRTGEVALSSESHSATQASSQGRLHPGPWCMCICIPRAGRPGWTGGSTLRGQAERAWLITTPTQGHLLLLAISGHSTGLRSHSQQCHQVLQVVQSHQNDPHESQRHGWLGSRDQGTLASLSLTLGGTSLEKSSHLGL